MRQGLFREEAIEANRERALGEVLLATPISYSVMTVSAVVIALIVIAYVCWGSYTRKAHVSGYLAPSKGLIKVHVPSEGTLVEKHVQEGQRLKQGDTLFVLSTERSTRETAATRSAIIDQLKQRQKSLRDELAKKADIETLHIQTLRERIRSLESELTQNAAELATQKERVAKAQEVATRYRDLVSRGIVTDMEARANSDNHLDQRAKLHLLQRDQITLERDLNALRLELSSSALEANNQRAAVEREISTIEQDLTEHESRRAIVITAPCDGVATTILAERGQTATPATPLLSILPAGAQLQAQLLVPSHAIGFIYTRQTVAVRYQAFPYQRFGAHRARITEITRTLISPGETTLPVKLDEPVYRVTAMLEKQSVKAYGMEMPLQSGMLFEADVWLDRRRLIEWLFDPLYSITGRV
jgi:membrane fusion protein